MVVRIALGVYFLTAGGSLTSTDAVVMYDVTEHRRAGYLRNVAQSVGHRCVSRRRRPLLLAVRHPQSIYNIPFYLAGRVFVEVDRRHGGKARQHTQGGRGARTDIVAASSSGRPTAWHLRDGHVPASAWPP